MVEIPSRGILIGIEGIDATGKRTQSALLDAWLRSKNITAKTISFPDYSTILGAEIKAFLHGRRGYSSEVQHILFAANRWENKARIESLLQGSQAIIVNRYTESNLAYGTANGLRLDWLSNLEVGLPKTDMVIVLDAPPAALFKRRGSAKKDSYEKDLRFQEGARKAYLDLAAKLGWKTVDASKNSESTHRAVVDTVASLLATSMPGVRE